MSTQPNMRVRQIKDDEEPMLVDPTAVGCGFLLFPKEMAKILQEAHVHQALQTNKTELWAAVRRHNPSIPVHLMTTNKEVEPGDAVIALNHLGRYPGYTIALDPMQLSPDGGKTLITIYAGLNWRSNSACGPQEVIVAGPQKLLPGKPGSSPSPSETSQTGQDLQPSAWDLPYEPLPPRTEGALQGQPRGETLWSKLFRAKESPRLSVRAPSSVTLAQILLVVSVAQSILIFVTLPLSPHVRSHIPAVFWVRTLGLSIVWIVLVILLGQRQS